MAPITSVQVSISPIFYEQLFRTKVFCEAFMCLQFGFVIFCRKDFGAKAAHKMLVKLTPDTFCILRFSGHGKPQGQIARVNEPRSGKTKK